MNKPQEKLKKFQYNMTEPCQLQTPEDVNLKNSVVAEREPEDKNLIDDFIKLINIINFHKN